MRIRRFRQAVTIITTAVAIGTCVELQRRILEAIENSSDWKLAGLAIAFLVSITISYVSADFIVAQLVRFRGIRKWLCGHTWIEGTWIFDVYEDGKEIRNELATITYIGPDMNLSVQTKAFRRGEGDFTSVSTNIVLDENLAYINYFTTQDSPGTVLGIAIGHFTLGGQDYPTKYRGEIFYRGPTPRRTEQATRIPFEKVDELKRKHGSEWESQLIRELRPASSWNFRAGELAVRRAKPNDLDEIAEIAALSARSRLDPAQANNVGYLISDYELDDYRKFLEFADYFYVVVQNDVVVGYLLGYSDYRIPDTDHVSYVAIRTAYCDRQFVLINQVCVRPQLRRKGLAQALYQTLEREASESDLLAAIIVDPPNRASVGFHESEGFELIASFVDRTNGVPVLYRRRREA
ncbi:MAG: GNAT family N-acetyltransferase [Planctomycetes bacterium]|nr:GNAT family N-acetyltransferase [Planctomycetota bacterium]MCB9917676.1 GNAT family N-acetyltransferase [Planctomycetota bacterium]